MATLKTRSRRDGGQSHQVTWRLGGTRIGPWQAETIVSSLARAQAFKQAVEDAGHQWPEGWEKGKGYVQPREPKVAEKPLSEMLHAYISQSVKMGSYTKRRARGQVDNVLVPWECCHPERPDTTYQPFAGSVSDLTEDDLRHFVTTWPRSLKTKKNYIHGLLSPAYKWAIRKGWATSNPCDDLGLPKSGSAQDVRWLYESEFSKLLSLAPQDIRDLLEVAVGTGLRFSELGALWVSAVDLERGRLTVDKAWKKQGEAWEADSGHVTLKHRGLLKPKHAMRQHYLGNPKTPKSNRTIRISPTICAILRRNMEGKAHDDFIFTSPTGKPLHHTDFYEDRWKPLLQRAEDSGLTRVRPRFHDLRHTHAVWLITGGAQPKLIQKRLGHESITTTMDTYGDFMDQRDELVDAIIDAALSGQRIQHHTGYTVLPALPEPDDETSLDAVAEDMIEHEDAA